MSEKVFRAACQMDEVITIGGGEPTLHPQFWKFLAIALAYGSEGVWLATNGSQTETALVLAKMAQRGVLGVALSRDHYHRDIEPEVVEAFTSKRGFGNDNDRREIRSVREIMSAGRGKDISGATDKCPCSDAIVKPDGRVVWCGCDDAPYVGNVLKGHFKSSWEESGRGECYKSYKENYKQELSEVA
jgi:MoaA/NifB/PqqE/SkfB family radical SAM enzyme